MKNLTLDMTKDIFGEFALTIEEMINVRGGDGDPVIVPTMPPIKI